MQKVKKILTISLVCLLVLFTGAAAGTAYQFNNLVNKINRPTEQDVVEGVADPDFVIDDTNEADLGINKNEVPEMETEDDIYNILLFGIDQTKGEKGRSDVICICSINKTKGTITLVSVLRDTLLDIPGRSPDKAAHAYSYGGPQLAIATINSNFKTDITDYATVNFNGMEDLIDAMGGVNMTVTKAEMGYVNRSVREVNRENGRSRSEGELKEYGENILLTGRQAVGYARIRKIGNDYERSNRQRRVLEALLKKGLQQARENPLQIPTMLEALLPMITTSASNDEIIGIAQALITSGTNEIIQDRLPADGEFTTGTRDGSWVITPDMDKARERLHAYLYKEETARDNLQPTGTPAPAEELDEDDLEDE